VEAHPEGAGRGSRSRWNVGARSASDAAAPAFRCAAAPFEADITTGPDQDLSLSGSLSFVVDRAGRVSGQLVHYGQRDAVSGRVSGRALQLVFQLRSGRSMRGTATAVGAIRTCHGIPRKGAAAGPRAGDRGVWGYGIGG
jgi:hypothetical protein